jgi:hypothetical protein
VAHFNISISLKRSSTELFRVTQLEGESTQAYLRRFNEEILKVEELIKPTVL